jgi:hypothetical protein
MKNSSKIRGGMGMGEASMQTVTPVDSGVPVLGLTLAGLGVGGALAVTAVAKKGLEKLLRLDKTPEFDISFDVKEGRLGVRDSRTTADEEAEAEAKAEEIKDAKKAVKAAKKELAAASNKEERKAARADLKVAEEHLAELLDADDEDEDEAEADEPVAATA